MARVMNGTAGRERMILSGIAALVVGGLVWLLTWAAQDQTGLTSGAERPSVETAVVPAQSSVSNIEAIRARQGPLRPGSTPRQPEGRPSPIPRPRRLCRSAS